MYQNLGFLGKMILPGNGALSPMIHLCVSLSPITVLFVGEARNLLRQLFSVYLTTCGGVRCTRYRAACLHDCCRTIF